MTDEKTTRLVIAEVFSPYPAGRHPSDGEFCGAAFRQDHLVPALRNGERVEVVFDGVAGVGSSFLEEAFGGLVREEGMSTKFLDKHLVLSTTERDLDGDVEWAKQAMAQVRRTRR